VKLSPAKRTEQARAVTEDAKGFSGPVVIAGDLNDYGMAARIRREGYAWLTEWVVPTHTIFSMDHILTRGLVAAEPRSVGVVRDVHGASDHHPVWAVLMPSPAATLGSAGSPDRGHAR
jgi:endonuclease/exonuclease/phosphatase family metal-dependent hydrolase